MNTAGFLRKGVKLRHLHLVLALDEHRQIGRVADALHVTQPAVSKALAELESGLGYPLFVRHPRRIEPTPHGLSFIRNAQAIVDELSRAGDELLAVGEDSATTIAVGVMPGLAVSLVPRTIRLARDRMPRLNFSVVEGASDVLIGHLRAGVIDIALGAPLFMRSTRDLKEHRLAEDAMCVAVQPEHALLLQRRLDWPALLDYPWLLPLRSTKLRHNLDAAFRRMQVPLPKQQIESVSVGLYFALMREIDALAFVPKRVARRLGDYGQCRMLPLDIPGVLIPLVATTLQGVQPSRAMTVFLQSAELAAAS